MGILYLIILFNWVTHYRRRADEKQEEGRGVGNVIATVDLFDQQQHQQQEPIVDDLRGQILTWELLWSTL